MDLTVSVLVNIASICLLILAPYTIYQKTQLGKLGGFRHQQNELREVGDACVISRG